MNKCKDCKYFDHPDNIECEYEKCPWLINGEERGWCRKAYKREDRVAYGFFVTPNITACPYFKHDPRNWDGISESVKERFDLEDWSGATFTWSDEENDGDDGQVEPLPCFTLGALNTPTESCVVSQLWANWKDNTGWLGETGTAQPSPD